MGKIILSLLLCLGLVALFLNSSNGNTQKESMLDYSLWANVLNGYVNDAGRVNYEGLKNDRGELDRFVAIIENYDMTALSPVEEKAFWINAYNAITLKVVLDNYPVKSIRRINFGLVWNVGRKVAGGKKSLGDIEHKILRPMGDPRIHFAINCASISCPNLPNVPFYPETLEEQLEKEAKKFVNNPEKVRLDRNGNILHHSAIFNWFEEDFLKVSEDLTSFIKKYINSEDKKYLDANSVNLKEMEYDWGLNLQ